jgi:hypothetical protein
MKIADSITYCSSCHGQYLERKHVDFEAYYDGPVIDTEGDIKVSIDNLIICSECLKNAGALVGLFPAEDLKEENKELGEAIEAHEQHTEQLEALISDMENTLSKFTSEKIQRPARRPRFVEVQ